MTQLFMRFMLEDVTMQWFTTLKMFDFMVHIFPVQSVCVAKTRLFRLEPYFI